MAARKHIPQRTCVVCRETRDKRSLTRLVKAEDGVYVDPGGKAAGRGAYLCEKQTCWDRAVNTTILAKALRTDLTEADRSRIRQAMPAP